jgi:hypothetical protein
MADDSRQAGALEITPAMIEAGAQVLLSLPFMDALPMNLSEQSAESASRLILVAALSLDGRD